MSQNLNQVNTFCSDTDVRLRNDNTESETGILDQIVLSSPINHIIYTSSNCQSNLAFAM